MDSGVLPAEQLSLLPANHIYYGAIWERVCMLPQQFSTLAAGTAAAGVVGKHTHVVSGPGDILSAYCMYVSGCVVPS
jgi:hypothetical protein